MWRRLPPLERRSPFLALPHGVAASYARGLVDRGVRVIDLSADFRLDSPEVYEEYYGNPHRTRP